MTNQPKHLKIVLVLFLVLIIGVAFTDTIADYIYDATNTYPVVNETFTSNTTATDTLAHYPIVTGSLTMQNSSGTDVPVANFTIDYTAGTILYTGSSEFNNTNLLASYSYTNTAYINDGISRTLVNLIVLFFVLAILVFAYFKIKDTWDI